MWHIAIPSTINPYIQRVKGRFETPPLLRQWIVDYFLLHNQSMDLHLRFSHTLNRVKMENRDFLVGRAHLEKT